MSREIPLSQGKVAIVDDEDFEWLSQWKWSAARRGKPGNRQIWYAVRCVWDGERNHAILMHRLIAGAVRGELVDHRNHDGLDNRRVNLRAGTQSHNMANSRRHLDSVSKFKGVWWHKQNRKWCAEFKGKKLGLFADEATAAKAYDKAALAHWPDYAAINFPNGG